MSRRTTRDEKCTSIQRSHGLNFMSYNSCRRSCHTNSQTVISSHSFVRTQTLYTSSTALSTIIDARQRGENS